MKRCESSALDDLVQEALEVGTGALILGLRQVNIKRRQLVKDRPETIVFVDLVLDQIDEFTEPVSSALGAAIEAAASAIPGQAGERLSEIASTIAVAGPELIRMSGLTKRD